MTEEQRVAVAIAQQHFIDEYLSHSPHADLIVSVGVANRLTLEWSRIGGSRQGVRHTLIARGDDPDELFLFVGLKNSLPSSLRLPAYYEGFRVYTEVVDETLIQFGK